MNQKLYNKLATVIQNKLDHRISSAEIAWLDQTLVEHPQAVAFYVEAIANHIALSECTIALQPSADGNEQPPLMLAFAGGPPDHSIDKDALGDFLEKAAQQADTEDTESIRQRAEKKLQAFLAEQEAIRRQTACQSRPKRLTFDLGAVAKRIDASLVFAKRFVVGSAVTAALLLILLAFGTAVYRHIEANRIVATLGPSLHALWESPLDGNELKVRSLYLKRGYAQLTMRQGADLLIQAPCRFELVHPNRIRLLSGTVTANVPERAHGFVVDTPGTYLEDFGTEFGITVNQKQHTEIHVFKGEVGIGREPSRYARNLRSVKGGKAAQATLHGEIFLCNLNERPPLFARSLSEAGRCGIPGERLDLSDVIGGGNGFGTGQWGGRSDAVGTLNPLTGRCNDPYRPGGPGPERFDTETVCTMQYVENSREPFIDGTFIPDGGQGTCRVSSQGHVFEECPDTDAKMEWNIVNGWRYAYTSTSLSEMLQTSGISMHANSGVTFDLDQMRTAMPGSSITGFTARAGLPPIAKDHAQGDVWVLIDGEVRFHREALTKGQMPAINIGISPEDRFLTLVTTDGQSPAKHWSSSDWFYFDNPMLSLSPQGPITEGK